MKALLKTKCGCSRMVEIPDWKRSIKIPIKKVPICVGNSINLKHFKPVVFREFLFYKVDVIDEIEIVIYMEK